MANLTIRLDSESEKTLNELCNYYESKNTFGTVNKSIVIKEALRSLYSLKIGDGNPNDVYLDMMKTQIEETMKPIMQRLLSETDAMVERVYLAQKLALICMDVDEIEDLKAQGIKSKFFDDTKEYEKAIELKLNDSMEVR